MVKLYKIETCTARKIVLNYSYKEKQIKNRKEEPRCASKLNRTYVIANDPVNIDIKIPFHIDFQTASNVHPAE